MSSIISVVKKSFDAISEKYPMVFWNIDLHGVCFKSNYVNNEHLWVNDECINALKEISKNKDSRIILWSSCYPEEQIKIKHFMESHGITVDFFNENPLTKNTHYGDFSQKYYFSILLDDKAGFEPNKDWRQIYNYVKWINDKAVPLPTLPEELMQIPEIVKALEFATRKHGEINQQRKLSGIPYIAHPIQVATILYTLVKNATVAMYCACLLHDTVEDTNTTLAEIIEEFGMEVAILVDMLTDVSKPEDGNRKVRKEMDLKHTATINNDAKTVKLCDCIHNTYNIVLNDKNFGPLYMKEKKQFLAVLVGGDSGLYDIAKKMQSAYNDGIHFDELPEIQQIKHCIGM